MATRNRTKNFNKNTKSTDRGARLAPDIFSELNATLYEADPAEFFRFRIFTIAALVNDNGVNLRIDQGAAYGAMRLGPMEPPPEASRLRYAALESMILVHHAAETLIRLYMAHAEPGRSPWLEVAQLRSFSRFKDAIAAAVANNGSGWKREQIGRVFLGGETETAAGLATDQQGFASAVDGYITLLTALGQLLLSQSDLYNAAKHGLVGVPQHAGSISFKGDDGRDLKIGGGPSLVYLHQKPPAEDPALTSEERWRATLQFVRIDSNLLVVEQACRAISSIWSVAQRDYTGVPGRVVLLDTDEVNVCFVAGHIASQHLGQGLTYELPITRPDATGQPRLEPPRFQVNMTRISDELLRAYDRLNGEQAGAEVIDLPLRTSDVARATSSTGRHLLPFSPDWSSSV